MMGYAGTAAGLFKADTREASEIPETPPDVIPTIDQEEPVASYQDWSPEATRVVVYTTDPGRYPKDRVAADGMTALQACEAEFGTVLQVRSVPYRYFFRVRRVH